MALWFVPFNVSLKPISKKEIKWKETLNSSKSIEYEHSRGYVREALSQILGVPPLDVPIISPPGLAPKLPIELGYVSFSHCKGGLVIGWSIEKIGVDVERIDRFFEAKKILNKFFSNCERKLLQHLNDKDLNSEVLKLWVRKEAAIKWQKGSIFSDLSKWVFKCSTNTMENKVDGYKLRSLFYNHENWYISVASGINLGEENPIICQY